MRFSVSKALATGAILAATWAAWAEAAPATSAPEGAAAPASSADACVKTVHAMGASMGPAEEKATEGRVAYHFVVRTNGLDYDVVCDAATGLVKDVARRMQPDPGAQ